MSRPAHAHRAFAAIAALALVVSLGLVGWHRATVLHERCVEHTGEELELRRVASDHTRAADPAQRSLTESQWVLDQGDSDCQILAAAHGCAAAPASSTHHVVLAALAAPALPPALAVPASAALYRLAPKTSPPVRI